MKAYLLCNGFFSFSLSTLTDKSFDGSSKRCKETTFSADSAAQLSMKGKCSPYIHQEQTYPTKRMLIFQAGAEILPNAVVVVADNFLGANRCNMSFLKIKNLRLLYEPMKRSGHPGARQFSTVPKSIDDITRHYVTTYV